MSQTINSIRDKYPQYADISDIDLIQRIGEKYPVYLKNDPVFASEFKSVSEAKAAKLDVPVPMSTEQRQLLSGISIPAALPPEITQRMAEQRLREQGITPLADTGVTKLPEEMAPLFRGGAGIAALGVSELLPPETSRSVRDVVDSLSRSAKETAEGLLAPENLMILGAAPALPTSAMKIIMGAFSAQMAMSLPEQAVELTNAIRSGDPGAISYAAGKAGLTSLFTAAGAKYALGRGPRPPGSPDITPELRRVIDSNPEVKGALEQAARQEDSPVASAGAPETARAIAESDAIIKEIVKEPEVSNAVQERGPEALPVQVPPEAGQGMGAQVRNAEAPALPQVKEEVILFSDRGHELRAVGPLKEGKIDPDAIYTIEPPVISGGIADIRTGQGLLDSGFSIAGKGDAWFKGEPVTNEKYLEMAAAVKNQKSGAFKKGEPIFYRRRLWDKGGYRTKQGVAEIKLVSGDESHWVDVSSLEEYRKQAKSILRSVEETKVKPAAGEPPKLTGPGAQATGEFEPIPRAGFRPVTEVKRLESKVKLAKEYDVDKLKGQFDLLGQEIGDALTTGGKFLPKELRPEVAKGAPAELGTSTSKSINQYFTDKLVTLMDELYYAKKYVESEGTPEHVRYFNIVEGAALNTFRQVQELRRASHESLYFWNSVKGKLVDIANALGQFSDLKRRIPIIDQFVKNVKERKYAEAGKDLVEYLRVNLFTLASWTLDFGTNLAEFASRVPAWAALDATSILSGKPAYRISSVLHGIKNNSKNVIPFYDRFRLPAEVEVKLGTTVGGELRGFGKEIMVDFSEILKDQPRAAYYLKNIDRILAAPVRAKRAVDNFFGRLGSTISLYENANREAIKNGLKGDARTTFIDNYVKAPPREAVENSVKVGRMFKFDRDLTKLEEKFTSNILTKLALDAFPRWGMQFTRWAGEMIGIQPGLVRKIKNKTVTPDDIVEGLSKAATGWGGIYAFNQLVYDNVDANSMEYVMENGDRVRLSGRTPLPELYFACAVIRRDWLKAKAALPYISIPGARLLGGEPGGLLSGIVDTMRESMRGRYTAQQAIRELNKMVNDALPGKSTLGAIRALFDPTIREGIGAPIPGIAGMLPQKVDPTTGEPAAPMQRIPGTNIKIPTVAGTPFPGAVRSLNAIEKVLLNHGIGLFRPRRTSLVELPPEDVPDKLRKEYERLAGKNVKEFVGSLIEMDGFNDLPFDVRRESLQKMISAATKMARFELADKYGTSAMPAKQEPIGIQLLPKRLKDSEEPEK